MKKNIQLFLSVLAVSTVLISCKKNDNDETVPGVAVVTPTGKYILSEGTFGNNNTKLAYYDDLTATFSGDFFAQQNASVNGGKLGDTGNDGIIYGSKLYIVMNATGNVTVLDATSGKFIKTISFGTKQPRYAASARGKVYVTAYDNTVSAVDTVSLTIVKTITAGNNPEGIAASADYLYVANSGALNYPNVDSTVSLIDLYTETEIRKIKVGKNPNKIEINAAGNVFVSAYGDFGAVPASVSVINGSTNMTSINLGPAFQYSHIRIFGDIAYLYNNYGTGSTAKVYNTALNSFVRAEFITDGTSVTTPYGINIDPANGDVYIADALDYVSPGKVYCYTSAGVRKSTILVAPGINPNKIIFKK